jgi:hypothetical protein
VPSGDDEREAIAGRYREYGALVRPRSPLYAELALGVAHDRAALDLLATLPPGKRQPLLVFGAARALFGDPDGWPQLRAVLRDHGEEVTALARRRATQLNEPLRCATLLPLLARLPGPLALLEVGASAGLCLLPDRYAYEYDGGPRVNAGAPGPVLRCAVRGPVPLPQRVPEVVWRAGLDLAPVDLGDDEAVRWLEAFVPPDDPERLARLRAAAAVARADPPPVVAGDLRTDLPALAASAPDAATLVVYHSGVIAYLDDGERAAFAATVRSLGATWISNEPRWAQPESVAEASERHALAVCLDGGLVAEAGMLGDWLDWR